MILFFHLSSSLNSTRAQFFYGKTSNYLKYIEAASLQTSLININFEKIFNDEITQKNKL